MSQSPFPTVRGVHCWTRRHVYWYSDVNTAFVCNNVVQLERTVSNTRSQKRYSTEFLDSDRVSWKVLNKCGILPHRGQKFVFHLFFKNVFHVLCFSADSSIIGIARQYLNLDMLSNRNLGDVDGFYLGVWLHLTETKCGQQHCLKGWRLPDLLEEHAAHALYAGTSVRVLHLRPFPRVLLCPRNIPKLRSCMGLVIV